MTFCMSGRTLPGGCTSVGMRWLSAERHPACPDGQSDDNGDDIDACDDEKYLDYKKDNLHG